MHFILIILGSIGLIVGSLTAAFLWCFGFWHLFRMVGHPDWGPILAILVVPAVFALPPNEFLRMTAILILLFAVPSWFEGRAWRRHHG